MTPKPDRQFSQSDQLKLAAIMSNRRDVRGNNFLPDPVSDEDIQTLLQAAVSAPSVGYSQPWSFVVVRDETIKNKVANSFAEENARAERLFQNDRREHYASMKLEGIREAPVNIAVFYTPSNTSVLGQNSMPETGEYSVACAIQNIWLMARVMNIGGGWVSILNPDTVKSILRSPPEHKLIGYLCVGYVNEFYDRPELETLGWQSRKPLEDMVHYDEFTDGPPSVMTN